LHEGNVVEHLDGHTDIIHKKLRADWLPWSGAGLIILLFFTCIICYVLIAVYLVFRGMRKRDLLLRRYWRREDDGTYGTIV